MTDAETGLQGFAAAVEAARGTIADAAASVSTEDTTQAVVEAGAVDDQVVADVLEHPQSDAQNETVETFMFDDVAEDLLGPDLSEGEERDIMGETVMVPIDGVDSPVTVSELVQGYLRQADYTKKTQELAAERKAWEAENQGTTELMAALRQDPGGTIASLAVEVGLLKETDLTAAQVQAINQQHRVPSREEVQKQIEEQARQLVETDPRVQEAEDARLMREVNTQFANIEQQHGLKFSDRDKEAIMRNAVRMETMRLDLAFLDLQQRAEVKRAERKAVQAVAPQAPQAGRVADSTSTQPPEPATSVADAFGRALAETKATL